MLKLKMLTDKDSQTTILKDGNVYTTLTTKTDENGNPMFTNHTTPTTTNQPSAAAEPPPSSTELATLSPSKTHEPTKFPSEMESSV